MTLKLISRQMTSVLIVLVFLLQQAVATPSSSHELARALTNREKIYDTFGEITRTLSDLKARQSLKLWVSAHNKEFPGQLDRTLDQLKSVIKNKDLSLLIAHFDHLKTPESLHKRDLVIRYYYHALATWIYNIGNNPIYQKTDVPKGALDVASNGFSEDQNLKGCLNKKTLRELVENCLKSKNIISMLEWSKKTLNDDSFTGAPFATSYTGFLKDNKVTYLNQNPYDAESIQYMSSLKLLMTPYIGKDIEFFRNGMTDRASALTHFFNEEGLPSRMDKSTLDFVDQHRIFSNTLPTNPRVTNIFGEILTSIEGAQESIFMDIFFLGGSMGAVVAKKLIKLVQANKNLRVYFMTDRYNGLGYAYELDYIFNYLRAYAETFPEDRMFILPAQVTLKRTALPEFMDLLIDDSGLEYLINNDQAFKKFVKQMDTYPKAKADHSKIFVVDGKNKQRGIAFFGSKNLTDSSGSIAYDEVVKVEGPGVKAILDSYYYDLYEALALEYGGTGRSYLEKIYTLTTQKIPPHENALIKTLLSPVDVLGRSEPGYSVEKIMSIDSEPKGDTILEIGENNVYGTIRTAITQNIEAILQAKKQIIISDQLLYDPMIIRALGESLRKKYSETEIFVMLEPMTDRLNPKNEFQHVPNNLFLAQLKEMAPNRVHIKWKKTPDAAIPNLREAHNAASANQVLFSQKNKSKATQIADTYHLKTISIDGVRKNHEDTCFKLAHHGEVESAMSPIHSGSQILPVVISGSANKDILTMMGGFREFQTAIFGDAKAVATHDCLFWERWNDPDQSIPADAYDFTLPPQLAEKMKPSDFLSIIRLLLQTSYNFYEKFH